VLNKFRDSRTIIRRGGGGGGGGGGGVVFLKPYISIIVEINSMNF
jgi:hypothetical protein